MTFVLYAQIHQPLRLSDYRVFDVGSDKEHLDRELNKRILLDCAKRCYRPALAILKRSLEQVPESKIAFSISGLALEQLETFAPEVLFDIEDLLATGRVELLAESYYHSLSYVREPERFFEEVALHRTAMEKRFSVTPRVLRNTELIFDEALAHQAHERGFSHVLACIPNEEGVVRVAKSPIAIPLKNVELSDDIAFRFSDHTWSSYPLSASTYAQWVSKADHAHVFIDFETFGEHHREETGILSFLEELFLALERLEVAFALPSELEASRTISVKGTTSWADRELDLSAWLGNRIQKAAFEAVWALEESALGTAFERSWRELLTSDHFYYMATKTSADGIVHSYFNPYGSPYEAFIRYMNVVKDLRERIETKTIVTE
jgi:alpha-amylase